MKKIDEARLESDVIYRVGYVGELMGFGESDVAALHAAASHLAPAVPALVEAVYVKLFAYDARRGQFRPRQSG